jgi:hypothetical protein
VAFSAVVGDDQFYWALKTPAGQTCSFDDATIAAASEITRIRITGERMVFEYYAINAWRCIHDHRIPCKMILRLTTGTSGTENAGTFYAPTSLSGAWAVDANVGNCTVAALGRFVGFRASKDVLVLGRAFPVNAPGDGTNFTARVWDGTNTYAIQQIPVGAAAVPQYSYSGAAPLAAGAYLEFQTRHLTLNNIYCAAGSTFTVTEVL